jgi:ASC-1-like (ASCH) protein
MQHIAIVSKSWKVVEAILSGQKTIESRWLKNKSIPWDRVNAGDMIYFKETGGLVKAQAIVKKVEQYENLNSETINLSQNQK